MYIKRDLENSILVGAAQIPVIAIIGPRQSGKSTLAQKLFKDHIYLDMQDANLLGFAQEDPKGFLNTYKNERGIIIDEAQYAPALFSQIKVEADKHPQAGYFILSGSQNFLLHEKISESLAGRVYFYTLLPLSIHELEQARLTQDSPAQQIIKGFYPRVYQNNLNAYEYYENYISTYIERDIRTIRNIDNILLFKKFMQLCALSLGTTLNFTNLANDCGVTVATVKSWLSLLETSFVLFLLPSYHDNLGKRVTKSPKLYFYDAGLAAALIGIDEETLTRNRNLYGQLFENMIIVDVIKNYNISAPKPTLTFFRDSNHKEIDLIIELKNSIIAVEIKASETIQSDFFDTITWFKQQTNSQEDPVLIYGGDQNQRRSKGQVLSWKSIHALVGKP